MLRFWATVMLGACSLACGNRTATLQNPGEKPSVWYIRCKQSIKQCQVVAREVCKGKFDVRQATGENPVEEYIASLDSSQGGQAPPPAGGNWLGEMIVECDDAPPGSLPARPKKRAVPLPEQQAHAATPKPARPALPAGMLCVPGATQECLGPAACRGAQACAADGKAWERCDCGDVPVSDAPSTGAPEPAGEAETDAPEADAESGAAPAPKP